jgi:predicted HD phosphohydrolase
MTNQQHPITPPPGLVEKWANHSASVHRENGTYKQHEFAIATQAAQWGADQELEVCCTWLSDHGYIAADPELRAARRPKPPSLKEQALKALTAIEGDFNTVGDRADTIRRALEALDD